MITIASPNWREAVARNSKLLNAHALLIGLTSGDQSGSIKCVNVSPSRLFKKAHYFTVTRYGLSPYQRFNANSSLTLHQDDGVPSILRLTKQP
ncbi:hypothetical protein KCP73_00740 [Salmonella enterica subsp. enterica]|nr:hypothetical protein KCP73_00740 [Salmonella enterica subsp. enterica]